MEWTPQATRSFGLYAGYWAQYIDPQDHYGFVYPADWVLQSQPDEHVENKDMALCNNNAKEYDPNNPLMVCISIRERQTNLNLTLEEAANYLSREFPGIDVYWGVLKADFVLDTQNNPERVIFHYTLAMDINHEELRTGYMVFFRNPSGKMIIFSGWERDMSTAETQAIINSFVFGADIQITSPGFLPSRLVDFSN